MKSVKFIAAVAVVFGLLLANADLTISAENSSSFLGDHPPLTADRDRPGAKSWQKEGVDIKKYTKVLIAPIEIWIDPDSEYKGLDADELKALSDTLRKAITDELEPAYPVVTKPGPDVIAFRLALTNVRVAQKKRGLLGYTPIGFVVTTGMNLAGMRISLRDATLEAEALDSQSGERLSVLIDRQVTDVDPTDKSDPSWEEVEKTLRFYAKRFRSRMDAEHGR